jgi:hypothetical protein
VVNFTVTSNLLFKHKFATFDLPGSGVLRGSASARTPSRPRSLAQCARVRACCRLHMPGKLAAARRCDGPAYRDAYSAALRSAYSIAERGSDACAFELAERDTSSALHERTSVTPPSVGYESVAHLFCSGAASVCERHKG